MRKPHRDSNDPEKNAQGAKEPRTAEGPKNARCGRVLVDHFASEPRSGQVGYIADVGKSQLFRG